VLEVFEEGDFDDDAIFKAAPFLQSIFLKIVNCLSLPLFLTSDVLAFAFG
jgi:hypothetical protein